MYREYTLQQVKSSVEFDPMSGKFFRVRTWNGREPGTECGTKSKADGYIRVSICGVPTLAHRVAWFLVYGEWPTSQIDHANGDRSDNRIENLRMCSVSENRWNSKKRERNTSGYKGVTWDATRKKWVAQIMANRKNHHLGRFETPHEAHAAYVEASNRLHGEFARHE